MEKKEITHEEKIILLKKFLNDNTCYEALTNTLTEQELNNYIDENLDVLLEEKINLIPDSLK